MPYTVFKWKVQIPLLSSDFRYSSNKLKTLILLSLIGDELVFGLVRFIIERNTKSFR